jgi:hypothetical protein
VSFKRRLASVGLAGALAGSLLATLASPVFADVSSVTFSFSNKLAGGTATWTVAFTTGASGALTANTDTIAITAPPGSMVWQWPATQVTVNNQSAFLSMAGPNFLQVYTPVNVGNNTSVTVVITGVTNPPAGTYPNTDFAVHTSVETVDVNPTSGATFYRDMSSFSTGSDQTSILDCVAGQEHTFDTCSQAADGISIVRLAEDPAAPVNTNVAFTLSGGGAFVSVGAGATWTLQSSSLVTGTTSSNPPSSSNTIDVRAPSTPGTSVVTVYIQDPNTLTYTQEGTLTITWFAASALNPSEANSLVKIVDPMVSSCATQPAISSAPAVSSAPASGGTAQLCIAVNDGNGNPVNNAKVSVTITPVGLVNFGQAAQATTGASGIVIFGLSGSGLAGVSTIGISVTVGSTTTTFAPRTFTWTGALSSITLTNVKYAIGQGFTTGHVAKVVAKDSAGNNLTTSTLCTSLTVASSPALTGLTVAASPAWDATAGACFVDATTTALAAFGSTSITVSSTSAGVTSNAVTLYVSGDPDSFTVAFDKTTVAPGGTATFTITVKDANGLPVPDGTSTTAVTNGGALVGGIISGPSATSDTSNGVATYTLVAPNTTGVVTVTAVVDSLATQSASITVGAPVSVTATAGTALGVTTSGPFSTTTKVQALGKYVTWKFSFGAAGAGQTVEIWRAVKQADGTWSGFTLLTKRVANSNGDVFFYWRSSSATWISVRGKLGTTYTPALQARWK